jgi:hypothetical protein
MDLRNCQCGRSRSKRLVAELAEALPEFRDFDLSRFAPALAFVIRVLMIGHRMYIIFHVSGGLSNIINISLMDLSSDDFARAFGDALRAFLDARGVAYASAAPLLGVERETLYTYWTDDKNGKRRKPRIELLFLACVEFGFEFEYRGFRITTEALGKPKNIAKPDQEQLFLGYSRKFNLTEDAGQVSVRLKRQPGQVEFSVTLKAAS